MNLQRLCLCVLRELTLMILHVYCISMLWLYQQMYILQRGFHLGRGLRDDGIVIGVYRKERSACIFKGEVLLSFYMWFSVCFCVCLLLFVFVCGALLLNYIRGFL